MKINAKALEPELTIDDVDVYLPRGVAALEGAEKNPRGFFRIFQRHEGARFFGLAEYLAALVSLMTDEEIADTVVHAVPEGHALSRHETALTIEGPARALMVNETLLHFLSTGTRFRTLAATYPGDKFPWVFMGARYLSSEDLALATRALSEEGILSTVPRWADHYIGTESHAQIVMWGGLRLDGETEEVISSVSSDEKIQATVRATVAFARANPGVPLYVLGDIAARSVGCFEAFRATREACDRIGLELVGGRMDISKADLVDEVMVDKSIESEYRERVGSAKHELDVSCIRYSQWCERSTQINRMYTGMNIRVVQEVRRLLDEAGMDDFQLVVSSGIKLEAISDYVEAGASIVGIGEEAAYYLNKGQCNFTSDAVGYFQGGKLVEFAKEGRELWRVADEDTLANACRGFVLSAKLREVDLATFK